MSKATFLPVVRSAAVGVGLHAVGAMLLASSSPAASQPAPVSPVASREKLVFLGVRVLKNAGAGTVAWSAELPSQCVACRLVINDYAAGQNDKEFYFHAWVPSGALGPIRVKVDPTKVRRVLVSYTDTEMGKRGFFTSQARANGLATVDFQRAGDAISFTVPAKFQGVDMPPDDLADVSQYYTYIETPGVYIRIGHDDQQRRAGPYATGPWPTVEAAAALNLEFATREAISALSLEKTLAAKGVSTIMLMNFDTNYPTLGPDEAHEDWPPHWHMHLYWKDVPRVRRVSHFYISPEGLLLNDFASDLKPGSITDRFKRWYRRGEADETRTPTGDLVYAQTITPEGYFKLSSSVGACLVSPIGRGFDSGAIVSCDNGSKPIRVHAVNDPSAGKLLLFLNDAISTEYRYDSDTGAVTATKRF